MGSGREGVIALTKHRLDIEEFARSSARSGSVPRRLPSPTIVARRSGTRRLARAAFALASLMLVPAFDAGDRSRSPSGPFGLVRFAAEDAASGMGEEDVRDVMHVMSDSLVRLGELVALEGVGDRDEIARRRRAIDAELDVLEELGSLLDDEVSGKRGAGPSLTDHVLIDEHVAEFVRRVARARRFAATKPPSLGPAARLGRSCTDCHRRRDETGDDAERRDRNRRRDEFEDIAITPARVR